MIATPGMYLSGQAARANGDIAVENITTLAKQTRDCISQLEGTVEGIIERVCGAIVQPAPSAGGAIGTEKRPEPRSLRELMLENCARAQRVLDRITALSIDLGEL